MEAYIIGGARTAIGAFNGGFASLDAARLGAQVIGETLKRTGTDASHLDEVIMGNVLQAGLGQNPARAAAIEAGVPHEVPSFTVNKVCGSGLKSIALGAQAIAAGTADRIVAGGMEHMSGAPYLLRKARFGVKMGDDKLVDAMIHDGLWDRFYDCHMGITAENIAEKYAISRDEQDEFALDSQRKTAAALQAGVFQAEIAPVEIQGRKGDVVTVETDEHPRPDATAQSMARPRPAFKKDGTVTAANASGINDGAAAVLLVSKAALENAGAQPVFRVRAARSAALDPAFMGLGPINATRAVLKSAGMEASDLDLIEVNEAFAVQSIQVHREMKWDLDKVNVNGGAIALGHPIGASGARILVTLMHEMARRNAATGLASLCIGGGQGISLILERAN